MSWSLSGQAETPADVNGFELQDYGDKSAELREQVQLAKGLAGKLLESGVVGATGKRFQVSLSGHANPAHEPKSGWVNDCITISVSQMSPAATPEPTTRPGGGPGHIGG